MSTEYFPPIFKAEAFNCPQCNVYSHQAWMKIGFHGNNIGNYWISMCGHCNKVGIWIDENLVHPDSSRAPLPNQDMPEEIIKDFNEARSVINRSPRAAAAMFRLCLQKLLMHLGGSGNINNDIKGLVAKGELPARITKSLDIVRVIGNESVHPGQIDLNDDPSIASQLAKLINIITEGTISQTKEIDELYEMLPEDKRAAIERRDGETGSSI